MNLRFCATVLVASSSCSLAFATTDTTHNPKTATRPHVEQRPSKPAAPVGPWTSLVPNNKQAPVNKMTELEREAAKQRRLDAALLQLKLANIAQQPAPMSQGGRHQAHPRGVPGTLALNGSDDCSTPDAISGNGTFAFDNSAATTGSEGQSELICTFFSHTGIDNDIWFAWTAPSSGTATFALCGGTTMDSKIAAYAGSSCPVAGSAIACNDDSCSLQSSLSFPATGGNVYMLQLGNYPGAAGSSGTFTMNVVGSGPANDDCGSASAISGVGPFAFDTTGATTSTQQSGTCGTSGQDLWYDWTAGASGTATLSLCGSSFDSLIAVYDGAGCPSGGSAWCNDDYCSVQSQLDFPCVAGNHYMLQIGGYGGNSGSGAFTVNVTTSGPANDDCASAIAISGAGPYAFDTTGATTSTQQSGTCPTTGQDIWYDWTAGATGTATLSLCGTGFDTVAAVYDGAGCPAAGTSWCNDDSNCSGSFTAQSNVDFPCTSGNHYMLQIGGFGSNAGPGSFTVTVAGPATNDDCNTPTAISGFGTFPFDNSSASTGSEGQSESLCTSFGSTTVDHDVWFAWTAPSSGVATFSLCAGTTMDSKIAVYPGSTCPTMGSALACNDDFCGFTSEVSFSVTGGSTYMLQLGNFPGASGSSGTFTLSAPATAPPNDDCASATPIIGVGTFAFDTTGATTSTQPGLGCGLGYADLDVWYSWIAPASGICTFTLCNGGVAFDSLIAAYDGSGCPAVGPLACNDDSCGAVSQCSFNVVAGNPYELQIGAFSGGFGAGSFDLSIAAPPPPCTPWDDGSTENLLGFGAGGDMVWLNRFGAPGEVNTIDSVDIMWGSALFTGYNPGNGTPTDVFIYVDGPTQDGDPTDATLLVSIPTSVTAVDTDTYVNFPIAPRTITGVFFVGSHQTHAAGQFVAPLDMTAHPYSGVSWFFGDYTSPLANYANPGANTQPPLTMDAIGIPGQCCVRVNCNSGPATYLCEPGLGGVGSCPCSNPPSGSSRGCDNSAVTGGAYVIGTGSASTAGSTLTFTSHNQVPSSSSMLIQGDALSSAGLTFGQGVRCTAGNLRRMYVHFSSGGSASFPTGADLDVATRSANLGDPLAPGDTRWYSVIYRDMTVLGGCSPLSTFNITNTAQVTWQ
jgi:hypothetical protein